MLPVSRWAPCDQIKFFWVRNRSLFRGIHLSLLFTLLLQWSPHDWSVESQGCQMLHFHTKNTNLGISWRALEWKMLVCFMAIRNILCPLGVFYVHLVYFVAIWYIFSVLYQDKSGSPGQSAALVNVPNIGRFCLYLRPLNCLFWASNTSSTAGWPDKFVEKSPKM
jgi:hypothetical protein